MADQVLDAKGILCPLPVLRARKALATMAAGSTLEVIATDPGSVLDFQAFCRMSGHELVEQRDDGTLYHSVIRKG